MPEASVTIHELVDELARVFSSPDEARALLHRAGFPAPLVPAFSKPVVFWSEVERMASNGVLADGLRTVVQAAAAAYPHNRVFAPYIGAAGGPFAGEQSQGHSTEAPTSTPIAMKRGRLSWPPDEDADQQSYDVFLSHNSEDEAAAEAIAVRLQDEARCLPFLDKWNRIPGERWISALERGLEQSKTVAIFVGSRGAGDWQEEEKLLALLHGAQERNRRVIPVLLPGARPEDVKGFLRGRTWVDLADADGFDRLVAGILGVAPAHRGGSSSSQTVEAAGAKSSETGSHLAALDSAEARLEAAYDRREELTVAGEDTTAVQQEILGLRRQLRSGPTLHAGEHLGDGRFRLMEVVGRGGFATVWKAYDRTTGGLVAVKVLHGQLAQEASRRERLFRGARKMSEVQHPCVVRVVLPDGEEYGFHYYVMEYVAGGDLHRAVIHKRLSTHEALRVVEGTAEALEHTHSRGLVHRDVKPQNILLREDGRPALSDFDLVQAKDTTGGTRTGALGTVLYAAPEQNDDASTVDHRADVFSLGMTAAFCVYGRKLPKTAMYHRNAFLAELPCGEALRAVLSKAVALRPEDRFESMRAFREELVRARTVEVASEPGYEALAEPVLPQLSFLRGEHWDAFSRPGMDSKRSRRSLLVGGTAVLGSVTGGLWLWRGCSSESGRTTDDDDGASKSAIDGDVRAGAAPPERTSDGTAGVESQGGDEAASTSNGSRGDGEAVIRAPRGGVELMRIPGGRFLMGSPKDEEGRDSDEGPQHEVVLAGFYLACTPVTNAQYREYMKENRGVPEPRFWGDRRYNQDKQPVVGVSWEDAQAYCTWAGLSLPTEAQWEYACRAGTTTRYYSGDAEEDLARVGWYGGNSGGRLHPVGEFEPNAFGLYDMHGNVYQWCEDTWGSYQRAEHRAGDGLRVKPVGVAFRVFRGGYFDYEARYARSAYRFSGDPGSRGSGLGFRPSRGTS